MKYNRADEEYINMLVTERYWKDIKDAFKSNADNETKQIRFGSNYYQCRINKDGFCIGAKDICNPEILDLTEAKEYIENAIDSIHHSKGLLESININTLNEKFENIKEEIRECYKEINEIEENSYVNQKKNVKEKEIERD